MKKILLLMTIALPFAIISSCYDDKDDEPVAPDNHEYVDLGLPSGTLWATCNVGATSPEDMGDYFAWGETAPKEIYDMENYKWYNSASDKLTKYCTDDYETELHPEDDAAYVNWGPQWRMPTLEQQQELIERCTWQWVEKNGVYGRLVTGPNGNTIFLPAADYRSDNSPSNEGSIGAYWSRTLDSGHPSGLYFRNFDWESVYLFSHIRSHGFTVRPVRVSKK
jgi:hypothetical protein